MMTSSEWGPNLQVIRAIIITGDGFKKKKTCIHSELDLNY